MVGPKVAASVSEHSSATVQRMQEPMDDVVMDQGSEPSAAFGHLVEPRPGSRIHFCISCSFPVAVFGRLYPCLHAYCLACASDMSTCFICHAPITRIERYPRENGIYISPATMQSFKTEEELINHTRKVHQHLIATAQAAEKRKAEAARLKAEAAAAAAAAAGAAANKAGSDNGSMLPKAPSQPLPPAAPHPPGQGGAGGVPQPAAMPGHMMAPQQQMQQQMAAQQQQMMMQQQQMQNEREQQMMMQQQQAAQAQMAQMNQRAGGLMGNVPGGGMVPGVGPGMQGPGMQGMGMGMGMGMNPGMGMQGTGMGGMQGQMQNPMQNPMQQMHPMNSMNPMAGGMPFGQQGPGNFQ